LLATVIAVATMGFQKAMTTLGERHGALASVKRNGSRKAFVAQVAQVRFTPIVRFVTSLAEVTFGHEAKRPDSCERATVIAVECVPVVAIRDDLSIRPAGQLETVEKHDPWIRITVARVALTFLAAFANIVWLVIQISPVTKLDPGHLDLADIVVAIAWIEIHHGF
jgi:hypothetical protein